MNPISAFFVRNIISVFFFYGLAFFAMGLALVLASRRTSELRFAQAIRPLAAFGILHGIHKWIEMFQKIAMLTSGYTPTIPQEVVRIAILDLSFLALLLFGMLLLGPERNTPRLVYIPLLGMVVLWAAGLFTVALVLKPPAGEIVAVADALARYSLGIPAALLGTWALMSQQRTFREYGMPQFGRDLVWCAAALFLYGVVGQTFVRRTVLAPSALINSTLFLQWFGIPVQVFRGVMVAVLAFYMVRALNAFELEGQRRLEEANEAKIRVQAEALKAERRISHEMERLNEELRLAAHELSLLLDLSNLLAAPMSLKDRLHSTLGKIVDSLHFPDAGMILLARRDTKSLHVLASTGFSPTDASGGEGTRYIWALELGEQCGANALVMCRHQDGQVFEFLVEDVLMRQECRQHASPVIIIGLPLTAGQQVIGSIVLGQATDDEDRRLSFDEFRLMAGMAQQLGLSIDNARLYQEAHERETTLSELLHQIVGAQESERQRIARELHDATGQSLTAIALGLRGVESMMASDPTVAVEQMRELKSFSADALGELRQIIADLRPSQLDDLGLVAALQWYVQEFEERYAIHVDLIVKGSQSRLPSEYETVLFRVAQEALTNIGRHAHASQATVRLDVNPVQVRITITDNGCGFDPREVLRGGTAHSGWGLLGIQERTLLLGGEYQIDSRPGHGARIQVSVPLIGEAEDVEDKAVAG